MLPLIYARILITLTKSNNIIAAYDQIHFSCYFTNLIMIKEFFFSKKVVVMLMGKMLVTDNGTNSYRKCNNAQFLYFPKLQSI